MWYLKAPKGTAQGYRLLLPPQHAHRSAIIRANDLHEYPVLNHHCCQTYALQKNKRLAQLQALGVQRDTLVLGKNLQTTSCK